MLLFSFWYSLAWFEYCFLSHSHAIHLCIMKYVVKTKIYLKPNIDCSAISLGECSYYETSFNMTLCVNRVCDMENRLLFIQSVDICVFFLLFPWKHLYSSDFYTSTQANFSLIVFSIVLEKSTLLGCYYFLPNKWNVLWMFFLLFEW